MFLAIDNITGKIIVSYNLRNDNYKNSFNKSLRYSCIGCIKDGSKCNDTNISFVNSKLKTPHFRHSSKRECSSSMNFIEFNIDFYNNWYKLFIQSVIKPYWFNINLKDIENDNNRILFRYSLQSHKVINNIEKYVNGNIIWVLSLETRKYNKIYHNNGKFYIDFAGYKNDIPIFSDKSIIFLDTGFDVLLKVIINSYCCNGIEVEIIDLKDFLIDYDNILLAYPLKKKWFLKDKLLNELNIYLEELKRLEQKRLLIEQELEKQRILKEQKLEQQRILKEKRIEKQRILKEKQLENNRILEEQFLEKKKLIDERLTLLQNHSYQIDEIDDMKIIHNINKYTIKELLNKCNDNHNTLSKFILEDNIKHYLNKSFKHINTYFDNDEHKIMKLLLYQEELIKNQKIIKKQIE